MSRKLEILKGKKKKNKHHPNPTSQSMHTNTWFEFTPRLILFIYF